MRLSQKLMLFVLAAAVVPLAVGGLWLLRQAEVELTRRLEREHRALATAAAQGVSSSIRNAIESTARSALLIDWSAVSDQEAAGGLRLLASQSELIFTVSLVDAAGKHQRMTAGPLEKADALDPVIAQLGLETLGAHGDRGLSALGSASTVDGHALLPVAIQVGPRGPAAPMVVATLDLTNLDHLISDQTWLGTAIDIADSEARIIATSRPAEHRFERLSAERVELLASADSLTWFPQELVVNQALPGRVGMHAFVSTPRTVALAPVLKFRRTVIIGVGVVGFLLVVVSMIFSRGLVRRLTQLSRVAESFAEGNLKARAIVDGEDEVADFSKVFNSMGTELEAARAKLLTWNEELQRRVDEALADLRAAQAQLLEAQKLAAIGQLGAGVAHEINNPLVGILGNVQLLLLERDATHPDFKLLNQIENSAKRCREITGSLLKFSQLKGDVQLVRCDLNMAVRDALQGEMSSLAEQKIDLVQELSSEKLEINGDHDAIRRVLSQLTSNARTALKDAPLKRITVSTRRLPNGGAELVFADNGKGIAPENITRVFEPFFTTKDVWTNVGLGLSVVYRIIEEHLARIRVESEVGKGARFIIEFPPFGGTGQTRALSVTSKIGAQES